MRHTLVSVLALLASYGLLQLGNGLFVTLIGVRTRIEGFATEVIGLIVTAYFAGLLVGALRAVRVVAAVGHIRAFAAFASLLSISVLVHPLWVDPWAWALLRATAGFCMAGMVLVTESWLNERSSNLERGRVMALYMIVNYLAAGSGQYLLPLADPAGFVLFSVASIVFSLALVPVLLTRAAAPRPVPPARAGLATLWRTSPLGVTGALCAGLCNSAVYGLGAVFAHGLGLGLTETSSFMASVIAGGLLLQWPLGRASDRVDRRAVIIAVALVSAGAAVALMLATGHAVGWLYAAGVVYGGFTFTLYSLSAAHANDLADPEQRVRTSSGLLLAYAVGACVGPFVAGLLMGISGPRGLFTWTGLVYATLGLFAVYRAYRGRRPERLEKRPIVLLPGGAFTSGQLHRAMRDARDRELAALIGGRRSRGR